jgi:hypothetical protein
MQNKKLLAFILWIQGSYILLTALWALIDIESFMVVSGPKTDTWLVKTVAILLLPISVCFFSNIFLKVHPLPVMLVAITTSAGLAFIDFYYTANHTIKWVYAIDGILQIIFLMGWIYLLVNFRISKI